MRQKLVELAAVLRDGGWPLSTGELVDCLEALELVDWAMEDARAAVLCTLAKDRHSGDHIVDLLRRYLEDAGSKAVPPALDVDAVLAHPPRLPPGEFARRLEEMKNGIRREVMALEAGAPGRGRGKGGAGLTAGDGAGAAPASLAPVPGTDPPGRRVAQRTRSASLRFLDLARADEEQLEELKRLLLPLGKKLAARRGYRKKPALSGSVDIRRTVKAAVSRGGVPLLLKRERRIPSSPLLVTLCDFSGSVAPYSRFFLQLLHGMHYRFRDMRSFAFVDRVRDISTIMHTAGGDWPSLGRNLLREAGISLTGFSNYGLVWASFQQQYAHYLTRRTTLVVLGDARNNWQPDGADIFRTLTAQCRRTIWLNPLPRESWNSGDCIMNVYEPACSLVSECRNAAQLARAIRQIL